MSEDTDIVDNVLDENTRRYYLEVMGVQCWQLIDAENQNADTPDAFVHQGINKDVFSTDIDWPQLETTIQQCTACTLSKTRKQAIAGRGNRSAELMFVLLAPDSSEDKAGVICHGEANNLFSKMLSAINVSINDVYITSLLKCCVPATHTISPKEIQACNNHLKQQVQLVKPKYLVVLGETAIRCLLQKNLSLDDYRAMNVKPQYYLESVPIFASYSPLELLQQAENKRKAWSDLQQLQKMIEA